MTVARPPRKLARAFARVTGEGAHGSATSFGELRVLDLACGAGQHLAWLAPGSVGVDRDEGALAAARARGLEVVRADLSSPSWSAELADRAPFEGALLADCLVHVERPEACLAGLRELLAPRAPVVVAEWVRPEHERAPLGRVASLLQSCVPGARAHWALDEHLHHWPESRWWRALETAGYARESRELSAFPEPLLALPGVEAALAWFWPPRLLVARAP